MKRNAVFRLLLCVAVMVLSACSAPDPSQGKQAPTKKYAAVARGEVQVQGGLLKIHARQAGNVVAVDVVPGQKIEAGQVLARLRSDEAQAAQAVAIARWHEAQAQEHLLAVRLPALKRTAQRWAAAVRQGAADQQQADDAKLALQQLKARLTVAEEAVRLSRAQLQQTQVALQALTLRAPVAGTVVKVGVQVGSRVEPDAATPVFVVHPQRPLIVRAEVNEAFVDRLHVGMSATLMPEAETQENPISAHVQRIGQVLQPARLDVDPQSQQQVVVCFLSLDHPVPLLIGQHVLVRFHD